MTVGEYLRKLREERQISLEEVSRETNIRLNYLEAIEKDQWNLIPSLPQARGFARLFAAYLGLSSRDVFDEVERLNQPLPEEAKNSENSTAIPASAPEDKPPPSKGKLGKKRAQGSGDAAPGAERETGKIVEVPVSQAIFTEIGHELKRQREALGLSLADVERLTRIREFFVYALESGQIDDLPSSVQGRGMLNNYASFLSLNSDSLQLRYAEGLQQRRREKFSAEVTSKKEGVAVMGKEPLTGWRKFLTTDLLVGGFVFITLFGLVIWGATKMINTSMPDTAPTISSISEILVGGATANATLIGEPENGFGEQTVAPTQTVQPAPG